MTTSRELAEKYFTAWEGGDATTLGEILAEDVDFAGALGTAAGKQACINGLSGMRQILTRIDVLARVAEGDDVITVFNLHTNIAEPALTANWMHIEHGRIAQIRVTFDPRGILAGMQPPKD